MLSFLRLMARCFLRLLCPLNFPPAALIAGGAAAPVVGRAGSWQRWPSAQRAAVRCRGQGMAGRLVHIYHTCVIWREGIRRRRWVSRSAPLSCLQLCGLFVFCCLHVQPSQIRHRFLACYPTITKVPAPHRPHELKYGRGLSLLPVNLYFSSCALARVCENASTASESEQSERYFRSYEHVPL